MAGKLAPEVTEVPECFGVVGGVVTRTTSNYYDLSEYSFQRVEKLFLCQQLRNFQNLLPEHNDLLKAGTLSMKLVVKRYNIKYNMVRKWLKRFDRSQEMYDNSGCPTSFDEQMLDTLKNRVRQLESDRDASNTIQAVTHIADEEYHNALKRRGRVDMGDLVKIQKKIKFDEGDSTVTTMLVPLKDMKLAPATQDKIYTLCDVHKRIGQPLSDARLIALHDLRVVYKVACAWLAFAGHNSAETKWNFDATTLIVSQPESGRMRMVVREREEPDTKVNATHINSSLNILIKVPVLGSAAGEIGPLVTIVAIPALPVDVYFKENIPGLSHGTVGAYRTGTIYLCHSKCGCPSLWRDIFSTFIIPTIRNSAELYKHTYSDGSPMEPFLHSDGETSVMNEAFDTEIMEAFDSANINYLKGGPSHTSKTQDLDCGHLFSSIKAGNKRVEDQNINVENATVRRNLTAALDRFVSEFGIDMGEMKEKVIYGHLVLLYCVCTYWTATKMRNSSTVVGIHTEDLQEDGCTIDFDRVMTRTLSTQMTPDILQTMKMNRYLVADQFHEYGECLNTYLDSLGIASTEGSTNRDDLQALCRRDTTLVTHEHTRARHVAHLNRKAQAAAEAAARKEAQEQAAVQQHAADLIAITPLLAAYQQDQLAERHADAGAPWKRLAVDKFKAFYRLFVPAENKPKRQPTKKDDWIVLIAPHLQNVHHHQAQLPPAMDIPQPPIQHQDAGGVVQAAVPVEEDEGGEVDDV